MPKTRYLLSLLCCLKSRQLIHYTLCSVVFELISIASVLIVFEFFCLVAPRKKGRIYGVGSLQFEASSAHSGPTLPSDDPVILSTKLAAAEACIQNQAEKINSFDILFDYLAEKDPALAAILRRGSSTQTRPVSANEPPVATAPDQQANEETAAAAALANLATGSSPSSRVILPSQNDGFLVVWDQLIYFKEYISKIKRHFGEEKAKDILEHSFFLVVSSSNDLAHTYLAQAHRYDRTSYANFLADSAVHFVRELHKLGARKIGVFSAVPVGCVPLQRTVFGGFFTRGCNQPLNNMAKQFNARLSPALDSLDKELDGVILYINVYDTLFDMIQYPEKYGFEVADRGCCGKGLLAISYLCNLLNPFTCSNSSAYIFWDSYHPSERAYQVIVDNLLDKYLSKVY
ncbi:putative GDSL lipase/esterase, SGNH hydrolase superfamily [Arabidopsis thaliana]